MECLVKHGEYKTPGGKLVVVDFNVDDGKLCDVRVSGDFFLYPEEALDSIRGALLGLPVDADRAEIARAVTIALDEGVEMMGFSPDAVAIAVERGLKSDA